jgi:sec-independent protein translocase protein TatB
VFDIAFSEIVVIGVVALVVIGPERLPKVARTLGHMFGRLQRYVNDVKADISREMELDELRKLKSEVQSAARDLESSVTGAVRGVETGMRSIESQLNDVHPNEGSASPPVAAGDAPKQEIEASPPRELPPAASTSSTPAPSGANDAAADPPRQAALPGFDRI